MPATTALLYDFISQTDPFLEHFSSNFVAFVEDRLFILLFEQISPRSSLNGSPAHRWAFLATSPVATPAVIDKPLPVMQEPSGPALRDIFAEQSSPNADDSLLRHTKLV